MLSWQKKKPRLTTLKKKNQVSTAGFPAKEAKANQKAGLTAIPAAPTRKQEEKLVNLVEEKKARKEQSILPADQHHLPAEQKAKDQNGVKRNENH